MAVELVNMATLEALAKNANGKVVVEQVGAGAFTVSVKTGTEEAPNFSYLSGTKGKVVFSTHTTAITKLYMKGLMDFSVKFSSPYVKGNKGKKPKDATATKKAAGKKGKEKDIPFNPAN